MRWHALHAFADTFNGYYKNGTEGTRDYRYFAGLYVILRIVPSLAGLGLSKQYYFMVVITCCAIVSLLFALLRPYKSDWINIWDSVLFASLTFALLWVVYSLYVASLPFEVVGVIATVPLVYIITFVVHKYKTVFQKCCVFLNKCRPNPQFEPDRLLNPEEYRQLLPNAFQT